MLRPLLAPRSPAAKRSAGCHVADLIQGRQILDALESEVVQELPSDTVERGPARNVAVGEHPDPLALVKGPHDRRADPHPAHVLDLSPGDRLAVGDEGEGLEERARVAGRPLPEEPGDPARVLRAHLVPEPVRHLSELEPPPLALRAKLRDDPPHRVAQLLHAHVALGARKGDEIVDRDRPLGREQHDLHDGPEFVLELPAHAWPCTWIGANGPVCTRSIRRSRHSSRIASRVTTTPARPSAGVNSEVNSTFRAAGRAEPGEYLHHAITHRERLARDVVGREHRGPGHHVRERGEKVRERDLGGRPPGLDGARVHPGDEEVAPVAGQLVESLGGPPIALVLLEAAHEVGARVRLALLLGGRTRQQQGAT